MFDPLSWALGYSLSKAGNWILGKWLSPDLPQRMKQTVADWAKGLPDELYLHPDTVFGDVRDDHQTGPSLLRLRNELRNQHIPSEQTWFDALAENRALLVGECTEKELQPFLVAEFNIVKPHLRSLATALHRICKQDEELFRSTTNDRLDQILDRMDSGVSPSTQTRLIREAAFAKFAREAVGNQTDAVQLLKVLEAGLNNPVLMSKTVALEALEAARKIAQKPDTRPSLQHVREAIQPIIAVLPSFDEYIERLSDLPFHSRGRAIEIEYYKVNNIRYYYRDFLAFIFLILLQALGEFEVALRIAEHRLLTIPPVSYRKAWTATVEFASAILGSEFDKWYHDRIEGKTIEELDPVSAIINNFVTGDAEK
jgi:hypothetical protein